MREHILTLRELNRATLARQCLLERASLTPLDAIKRLVGLQGQVSNAPYIGLWSRLHTFQRAELTALLENRQVVRASSMRITLHIMTAEDYLLLHPILQPVLSRNLHIFARQAEGFDMDRFTALMRAYIQEQPRTGVELRAKMEEFYPGLGKNQIADAVRMYLALIQIPPAGTWGFTGRPVHTEATTWLGRPLASSQGGLRHLVLRYLAAFGPTSVKDIQTASGLTGLQQTIETLRPELHIYQDEQGRELFDLPDIPLPLADTPAPVRFLPEYDNLILSLADRSRFLADQYRSLVFIGNGMRPTFLVDGFVRGTWKIEQTSTSTKLVITPFEPLSEQIRKELLDEGERLVGFARDGGKMSEVRFVEVVS